MKTPPQIKRAATIGRILNARLDAAGITPPGYRWAFVPSDTPRGWWAWAVLWAPRVRRWVYAPLALIAFLLGLSFVSFMWEESLQATAGACRAAIDAGDSVGAQSALESYRSTYTAAQAWWNCGGRFALWAARPYRFYFFVAAPEQYRGLQALGGHRGLWPSPFPITSRPATAPAPLDITMDQLRLLAEDAGRRAAREAGITPPPSRPERRRWGWLALLGGDPALKHAAATQPAPGADQAARDRQDELDIRKTGRTAPPRLQALRHQQEPELYPPPSPPPPLDAPPPLPPQPVSVEPAETERAPAFPGQCRGLAKSTGQRCRLHAARGQNYCRYHLHQAPPD